MNLTESAQQSFDALVEQTVGFAATTLEWAVRAEMVRDDVEDVQEYMQQLAKRPGVKRAIVSTMDGRIIAASEPKQRGRTLAQAVSEPPPESAALQILLRPEGTLRVVVPVMGLEARLGTLLVDYERPVLDMPSV